MPVSEMDGLIIAECCNDLLTQLDLMHTRVGALMRQLTTGALKSPLAAMLLEIAKAKQQVVEIKSLL